MAIPPPGSRARLPRSCRAPQAPVKEGGDHSTSQAKPRHNIELGLGIDVVVQDGGQKRNQFGPNSVSFLVAAEVFPTPIRASAHGMSAAWGKVSGRKKAVITAPARPNQGTT
jgi:predicted NUDIX family NTP pyrophosphohydrolase